jgi:hypothetical protein
MTWISSFSARFNCPCSLNVAARLSIARKVSGCSWPSTGKSDSLTCLCSSSAFFHRPWFQNVPPRLLSAVFSAVRPRAGQRRHRPSESGLGRIGRPGTEHSPSPAVNCRHPWIFLSVHNIHIKLITIILTLKQGHLASVLSIQCLIPLIKSCCIHDFRHSDACMTSSAKRLRRSLMSNFALWNIRSGSSDMAGILINSTMHRYIHL